MKDEITDGWDEKNIRVKKEEEPVKKRNHRRIENKDERTNGY